MQRIERDKAIADYLKHIGTISAFAAGIVATLTSRASSIRSECAAWTVVCLLMSLALSLITYGLSLWKFFGRERGEITSFWRGAIALLLIIAPLALILGFCILAYAMMKVPKTT